MKKTAAVIVAIVFMFLVPFSASATESTIYADTVPEYIYNTPRFESPLYSIIVNWGHIGSGTISQYADTVIQINGTLNSSDIFFAPVMGVVPGKTYLLTGDMNFQTTGNRQNIEFSIASSSEITYNDSFTTDNPNYYAINDQTLADPIKIAYCFKPDFAQVYKADAEEGSTEEYETNLMIRVILKNTLVRLRLYNMEIICLDDIVYSNLRAIRQTEDNIAEDVQQIVEYMEHMLYDEYQSNNISEMVMNQYTFFRWMMERYPNSIHSDFYKKYNQDFFIAIYEAITGENIEYTTVAPNTESIEEAQEALDALKVTDQYGNEITPDVAASRSFGEAMQAMTELQRPIIQINSLMNELIFTHPVIFAPVLLALALGLLVTILGKNKSD